MKKPKTATHKRNISKSMKMYWEKLKREEYGTFAQQTD